MSLTPTFLTPLVRNGNTSSTAAWVTGNTTVPANSTVVYLVSGCAYSSSGVNPNNFTLATSAAGTPTVYNANGLSPSWGYGTKVFYVTNATGSDITTTLTVGVTTNDVMAMWVVTPIALTGIDGTTPLTGFVGGHAAGNISTSLTLAAAPVTGDLTVGMLVGIANDGSVYTVTQGTGFTTQSTNSDTVGESFTQFETRTASTSTTVGWANTGNFNASSSATEVQLVAFNIKAAAAAAAPTVSSPTSSNVLKTTASAGATSDQSGTMYVVLDTANNQPTVAQIKAGQKSTGAAAVASANGAMIVGANLLALTGLTAGTTYYYFVCGNDATGDSGIVSGTFTTMASGLALLTSPTSSSVTSTTASVGATTDTAGTAYVVVSGTNTTPTTTQIKAGQNAAGTTVPNANGSVTTGAFTKAITGLTASSTYYYFVLVNDATGDGNIVSGTFTTPALPALSSPTSASVTGVGATIGATSTQTGTQYYICSLVNTAPSTTQIKAGQLASGSAAPASGNTSQVVGATTQVVTGLASGTKYYYFITENNANGDSNVVTGNFTTVAAATLSAPTSSSITSSGATVGCTTTKAGTGYVVLTTVNTSPSAAQIQAGQDSTGAAAAKAGNGAAGATSFSLALTGLAASTTYYYWIVENSTSAVSNIVTGNFTTSAASVATLSAATSASIAQTTATLGATTNVGSGTLYIAAYTGTTPTATQIKAGQNSSGVATPSGNVAVSSTGAKTIAITGLTAGTSYNFASVQNTTGGDSNILTSTFTTLYNAATLSAATSSSVAQTTATIGATTDTAAGTLYGVVYTGTTPSAAQIIAGQNSSGTTTPSANAAVSSTGAKTLNITGLTSSTAYNYALLQTDTGGNSNIVTGTFTTTASVTVATLSSPSATPNNTGGVGLSITADKSGTLYAVLSTTNSQPTTTQIKAGQNAAGTTVPSANMTAASGANALTISGLSLNTTYYYFATQNNAAGDSNVVTGSFTTLPVAQRQYWLKNWQTGTPAALQTGTNPFTPAAGSTLVVVQTGYDNTRTIPISTDSAGTFTIPSNGTLTSNGMTIAAGYQANVSAVAHTITPPTINDGTGGTNGEVAVWVYETVNMPSSIVVRDVVSHTDINATKPWTQSTGSTPLVGDIVFAATFYENSSAYANAQLTDPPTGFTSLGVDQDGATMVPSEVAYKIVSSPGAQSATWTTTDPTKNQNFALMMTLGTNSSVSPPVLSAAASSNVAGTTASVSASSTTTGTLYAVITTSATPPTATQIKAGQNNTGAAAVASTNAAASVGTNTLNVTGLTANTAYYYYLAANNAGGDSNVVSGTFTTTANTDPVFTLRQKWYMPSGQGNPATLTSGTNPFTPTAGNSLIAVWSAADNGSVNAPADTGGTWTVPAGGLINNSGTNNIWMGMAYQQNVAASAHTITPQTIAVGGGGELLLCIYEVTNLGSTITVRDLKSTAVNSSSGTFTQATGTTPQVGDVMIAAVNYENTANYANAGLQDPPSGWTSLGAVQDATLFIPTQISAKKVTSAGTNSITWTTADPTISEHLSMILTLSTNSTAPPAATLSSATSASIAQTTATLGATTDTGSGTLYVAAYTGSVPTATQIKAGQNSAGTATPSGNVAVSSTGAKTIAVTGLSAGTAYNYALVQNSAGGDSNVLTSTFTTLYNAATLTTPTSGSITATTVSVGATTDTPQGTIYAVVYTGTAPSAAQIIAGQNSSSAATPAANAAVTSIGAKTLAITGLTASTAYNYSVLHVDNGGNSNIVTGTFSTTAPASPATLTSPTSSNVASTSVTVGATTDTASGTLYAVAYTGTAPSAAQVIAGQNSSGAATPSGNVAVSTTGAKTINITGLTNSTAYNYALAQSSAGGNSNVVTGTFTTTATSIAQVGTAQDFGDGNSQSISATRATGTNNMLVAVVQSADDLTYVTPGWQLAFRQTCTDAPSYQTRVYFYPMAPGGSMTVNFQRAQSGVLHATLTEWSGMGNATVDKTVGNGSYGAAGAIGSTGTLSAAIELAVAGYYNAAGSGGTNTGPAGWVVQSNITSPIAELVATLVTSSTTALNPAWSYSGGSIESADALVTFKPGGSLTTPVLSAPTSTGIGGFGATVGISSTVTGGVMYMVVTTNNVAPSATQIKAGQSSLGTTAVYSSSATALSGANNPFSVTGLSTATTYYTWFVQDNGNVSNITGGNFTTLNPTATISSLSSYNPQIGSTLTITGTNFGATQGTGSVTMLSTAQTVTSWADTQVQITVSQGTNAFGTSGTITLTNNAGQTSVAVNVNSIQPQAGWSFVNIGTPDATAANRLGGTAVDLANGDQIAWDTKGGLVQVDSTGKFVCDASVTSFQYMIWTSGSGWGSAATQTITVPGVYQVTTPQAKVIVVTWSTG